MATYFKILGLDAEHRIPDFIGLNQKGNTINGNPCYAEYAEGFDTVSGTLQPFAKTEIINGETPKKIETIMHLHRRWANQSRNDDDIIVAAAGDAIYVRPESDGTWSPWKKVHQFRVDTNNPGENRNVWSWETYEVNIERETGIGYNYPVDVLLMSNAYYGMYMLKESETSESGFELEEVDCGSVYDSEGNIEYRYKFGAICRSAERIWGTCMRYDPDKLMYSRPYDPQDWSQASNEEQPEDGAGEINQPTWDGDSFTAIRSFGQYLLAFKKSTIWQITGTNPGEYTIKEQYGGGCAYPNTICVDAERVYMLSNKGIVIYNGSNTQNFYQDYCQDIWDRMSFDHLDQACAVIWKDKYYLSIPIDGSEVNNCIVIYNINDGNWLIRRDINVESWLATMERLYFTTVEAPYNLCRYYEDSWLTGKSSNSSAQWISPWCDIRYPNYSKDNFIVSFTPEVKDKPVRIYITIDTEKGKRTKSVVVKPIGEWGENTSADSKTVRIPFNIRGKRFRISIYCDSNGAAWRIRGGVYTLMDVQREV